MNCDSFRFFSQNILRDISDINDTLAVVGVFYIAKKALQWNCNVFSFLKTHVFPRRSNVDLAQLYGGDWAVVTGSSDGIGKAYAEELAKRGLNIVLISKDVKQLQDVAIEINEKYRVQVDFISITFDGDQTIYPQIKEYLSGKKIAILVNNVGVMYDYPQMFIDVPNEKLWQLVNVNVAAVTMMTHIILPDMVERGKGAIVNVSAGACYRPTPQMTVYSATKAYIDLFSRSLQYEYKEQGITIQCLLPFYVCTKLQRFSKTLSKPSLLIPTAQVYASNAIETLGYSSRTTGYWPHTIQAWIAAWIPERLWMWGANRLNSGLQRQALEKMRSRSHRNLSEAAAS